jgi:hypothetical protein
MINANMTSKKLLTVTIWVTAPIAEACKSGELPTKKFVGKNVFAMSRESKAAICCGTVIAKKAIVNAETKNLPTGCSLPSDSSLLSQQAPNSNVFDVCFKFLELANQAVLGVARRLSYCLIAMGLLLTQKIFQLLPFILTVEAHKWLSLIRCWALVGFVEI